MIPTIAAAAVPYVTTDQMIEVDRAMIEDYGIDLVRMMENAGRALAHLARARFLDGDPRSRHVVVLADISVPPELYERFLGIKVPPVFAKSDIVRLV